MVLFATTGDDSCAQNLRYGPEVLVSSGSADGFDFYLSTHASSNIQHRQWLQIVLDEGDLSERFRILWTFNSTKSVTERIVSAVEEGEPTDYLVTDTDRGGTEYSYSGSWRFSTNSGITSSTFQSLVSTQCCLSSQYGVWGAGNGQVDGILSSRPDQFWGVGVYPGFGESLCYISYRQSSYGSGRYLNFMYAIAVTETPTAIPTAVPSALPTAVPTTAVPSALPTAVPTTAVPSAVPTALPTAVPTALPTAVPTTAVPSAVSHGGTDHRCAERNTVCLAYGCAKRTAHNSSHGGPHCSHLRPYFGTHHRHASGYGAVCHDRR